MARLDYFRSNQVDLTILHTPPQNMNIGFWRRATISLPLKRAPFGKRPRRRLRPLKEED